MVIGVHCEVCGARDLLLSELVYDCEACRFTCLDCADEQARASEGGDPVETKVAEFRIERRRAERKNFATVRVERRRVQRAFAFN